VKREREGEKRKARKTPRERSKLRSSERKGNGASGGKDGKDVRYIYI